jgi:hypothetical protein
VALKFPHDLDHSIKSSLMFHPSFHYVHKNFSEIKPHSRHEILQQLLPIGSFPELLMQVTNIQTAIFHRCSKMRGVESNVREIRE